MPAESEPWNGDDEKIVEDLRASDATLSDSQDRVLFVAKDLLRKRTAKDLWPRSLLRKPAYGIRTLPEFSSEPEKQRHT